MTWRTLPIIDDGDGRIWNERNRWIADQKFLQDAYDVCNTDFPGWKSKPQREICINAEDAFYQFIRAWKYDRTLTTDEGSSVARYPEFIEYPSSGSVDCAPTTGRCLPVQVMTLEERPFAPQNIPYTKTGKVVELEIIRARQQYTEGPQTRDGLTVREPIGEYRNIGELTITVDYPLRGDDDVISCSTRDDQTFYIGSETYRPSEEDEDQDWRDTTIYIKACRDTRSSEEDDKLLQFFPRQGRYEWGETDLEYGDGNRVPHYQNIVADACRTLGDEILMDVRANTRKLKNIQDNPKVSLLLEPGKPSGDIKGLMVQGVATIHSAPEEILHYAHEAAKLRGVPDRELPTEPREGAAYIRVPLQRFISWDYSR